MIGLLVKYAFILLTLALVGCIPFVHQTVDVPTMLDRYVGRNIIELPGSEYFTATPMDGKHDWYKYQDARCNIVLVVNKKTKIIESWRHVGNVESCKPYNVYGGQPW